MFLVSSQHGLILLSSITMGERILGFNMSWNALKSKFPRGNGKWGSDFCQNADDKRVGEISSHVASPQSLEHACVSYGTCLFVSHRN